MAVQGKGEVVEGKKWKWFSVFSFNIHGAGTRDIVMGVIVLADGLEEPVFPYVGLFLSRDGQEALYYVGLFANNINLLN